MAWLLTWRNIDDFVEETGSSPPEVQQRTGQPPHPDRYVPDPPATTSHWRASLTLCHRRSTRRRRPPERKATVQAGALAMTVRRAIAMARPFGGELISLGLHDVTLAAYLAELHDAGRRGVLPDEACLSAHSRWRTDRTGAGRLSADCRRSGARPGAAVPGLGPGSRACHLPPAAAARA